nr:YhdP family protein [uncultured Pseudomonas sp.]
MEALGRFFVVTLRRTLGLCALGLVLSALYVSLGRELVPLVGEYRLEAEDKAVAALGMSVTIGTLEGSWAAFSPLLIAHDVQIGEGDGAMHLDQLRVVPDVLASLIARQPRIARLELEGLHLSLLQDEQGGWALEGLPRRRDSASLDIGRVLQQAQAIKRLSLLNSQVTLQAWQQPALSLSYVNLSLRNGETRQRLDGRLLLPDGQPLALQVRSRVRSESWRQAQADVYLSLPQTDWARWLPSRLTREWRLDRLQAGGEVWLTWADSALQRAVGRLHAPEIKGAYAERAATELDDVALSAYFQRTEQGVELLLDDLAFSQGETRWGQAQLSLTHVIESAEREGQWRLGADRLDLAPLLPLIEAVAPLPEKAAAIVGELKPHGALSNLLLDYWPQREGPTRLQFSGNLEGIGFAAFHASPAVENVTGSLSGDLAQGELRLATENFSLHLETLFPKPWRYRQAHARLNWQLDDQAFTLRSPYLQLAGEEGDIAGDFLIRLRHAEDAEDYMDLRVGLRNGDARYTEKYLPTRSPGLSEPLASWLKTAIRGGKVNQGYFQYQGSLNKGAPHNARNLSLYFDVEDAELAFQPGWPSLREGRGEVLIESSGVRVRLAHGRLLDSQIGPTRADVATLPDQPVHLLLKGQLNSSVGDALKILQEAPIGTAPIFAGWEGEGALDASLDLDIPLHKGPAPRVVVDFSANGARLKLSNPTLELSQLSGAFRYDTALGLSAEDIRARALGHALRGKARATGSGGQARSVIEARGQMPLAELTAWLGVTQAVPLQGILPYDLRLTLDGIDSQLRVDSNLKGLAVELPAPFGKAANAERTAQWRMSLGGKERRYWLDYAELASLSFAAAPGELATGRGELRLGGGAASLPSEAGLRVRGRLTELDWDAWQAALKPYASVPHEDAQQLFRDAQLEIARFIGFGNTLDNLSLQLQRAPAMWALTLDSERLKGRINLPDALAAPIAVDLDYLRFPAAEPRFSSPDKAPAAVEEEKPDPLRDVDPRRIPALDVHIAKVMQGAEALGAWSLKIRPDAQGVAFNELDLNLKGLHLSGSGGWQGAPGATSSWYKGRLQGEDLADVLLAWDYSPTASSESFHLDVDGNWPGSPAWASMKRFTGSMDASMRKGQFSEVQGPASALRVFGLLNFNSIGRRLRLDFSDLLGKGLSYDRVKGLLVAEKGVFTTREPITLTGPSSNLELNGTLDMADQMIDAKLLVTLPVSNNLPLAALIVGAPAIGGALFVADKLLGDRIARFASVQYDVKGSLSDPQISFDKPFEKPK